METIIAFVLDIVLVIAAIAAFLTRPRIGGQLAKGLQTLMIGIMVLGFAHLIETLLSFRQTSSSSLRGMGG